MKYLDPGIEIWRWRRIQRWIRRNDMKSYARPSTPAVARDERLAFTANLYRSLCLSAQETSYKLQKSFRYYLAAEYSCRRWMWAEYGHTRQRTTIIRRHTRPYRLPAHYSSTPPAPSTLRGFKTSATNVTRLLYTAGLIRLFQDLSWQPTVAVQGSSSC